MPSLLCSCLINAKVVESTAVPYIQTHQNSAQEGFGAQRGYIVPLPHPRAYRPSSTLPTHSPSFIPSERPSLRPHQ
jgi:hypothetical protein